MNTPLQVSQRPSPGAYNTPPEAIARLQLAFEGLCSQIAAAGFNSGELSFELRFSGQPDAVGSGQNAPKIELTFRHYHYSLLHIPEAKGLEYYETLEEFLRRLQREASLKQLSNQRS